MTKSKLIVLSVVGLAAALICATSPAAPAATTASGTATVVCLDFDSVPTASTLTVTGHWAVAAADIAAAKCANCKAKVVFSDTATVDLSWPDGMPVGEYVLATATQGFTCLPKKVGRDADRYRLRLKDNGTTLKVYRRRGLVIYVTGR